MLWMNANFLKLNAEEKQKQKTDLLLIGSESITSSISSFNLAIDGTVIKSSPNAYNISVIFDSALASE